MSQEVIVFVCIAIAACYAGYRLFYKKSCGCHDAGSKDKSSGSCCNCSCNKKD